MKQKASFNLRMEYWEWLKLLTDEELGRLLRAVYIYERERKAPRNLSAVTEMAFTVIKNDLDEGQKKYEALCNANKQKARIRWQNNSKITAEQ